MPTDDPTDNLQALPAPNRSKPDLPPGIVCPRCGGNSFFTFKTRRQPDKVVRVEQCKNPKCRRQILTAETVVSNCVRDRGPKPRRRRR